MKYIGPIVVVSIVLVLGGCGAAGKNFNSSKVKGIINGTTTQTDIKKIFGEPFKIGIQNGKPIWIYENHHYSIINKNTSKDLIIILSPDGIVESHQFTSNEPAL